MPNYNDRIRQLRNRIGFSQADLANVLEISKSSIAMYERGEREPGIDMLKRMASFFNVSLDFLLGEDEYENDAESDQPSYESPTEADFKEWEDKFNPCGQLAEEVKMIEYIQRKHGKTAVEAAEMYVKLDNEDKAEIRGEMKGMLKNDKYKSQDKGS